MEQDNELERELRRALSRVEAPEGFAERVALRAREQSQPHRPVRFSAPVWRMAYAAAALLAVVAGSVHLQRVHESERRAAEAQQQFARAMGMTDHALDRVAVQLQRSQIGQITGVLESER